MMFKKKGRLNIDNIVLGGAALYVVAPILIFFWGWLRPPVAILTSIIFICFIVLLLKDHYRSSAEFRVLARNKVKFWIPVLLIILIWAFFSGIGGFAYQNDDFWVRNPIFRDLSEQPWPVIYDLSEESEEVQNICGSDTVAFSYYFCWWLPVALLSKVCNLNSFVRNFCLYLWTVSGLFLVIFLLCRKLKKCSWYVPVFMVCFSGMDVIVWNLRHIGEFTFTNHLEWWANFFQYSSNTTQLYWVFNQSIPIWIIMGLLLQLDSPKYIAALGSLAFGYSPWATFGVVPFAICASIKKDFRKAVNAANLLVPTAMLIVFGTFYFASSGSDGFIGTIFSYHPGVGMHILAYYIAFVILEFGVYFFLMGKGASKYEFYWITLVELVVFPLVVIRDYNFIMRGSIPALFVLMYYAIRFFSEGSEGDFRRAKLFLTVALCIGAITPLCEINRSIITTISSNDYLQEDVYSFADIKTEDTKHISTIKEQFFIYDFEKTLFFRYLAK